MAALVVVVPMHLFLLQRLYQLVAMVAAVHMAEDSIVRSLPVNVQEVESDFDSVNSPSFPDGQRLVISK